MGFGKTIGLIGKIAKAVASAAGWLGGLFASRPKPAPLSEPAPVTQRSAVYKPAPAAKSRYE
jgi:hypothetical protein